MGPAPPKRGLSGKILLRSGKIQFHAPYKVLQEEDRRAAIADISEWIRQSFGADTEMRVLPE